MYGLIRQLILVITCSVVALWVRAETYRVDVIQLPAAESSSTLSETLNRVDWGAVGRSTKAAWDKMGNEGNPGNSSSGNSSVSPFASVILIIGTIIAAVVGVFLVFALVYKLFSFAFGGECLEQRSQDGLLLAVKKPRSVILALTVLYSLSITSSALALFQINAQQRDLCVLLPALLASFLFWPLSVSLHMGSRRGQEATGSICVISFVGFALWGGIRVMCCGLDWGRPLYIGMVVSFVLFFLLLLEQTNLWLSAKEELRQNKRSKDEVNQ